MTRNWAAGIAAIVALGLGGAALAQHAGGMGQGMGRGQTHEMMSMHERHHGAGGMGMGGTMGRGMQAMLHGPGSTESETIELASMFHNHTALVREVVNLPNGIDTLTESQDPELRAFLVSHVVGMIGRVDEGRDPQVPIQSPTLDILFANRALIDTVMEATDHGIRVIQTSDDPETVAALQTHAAEVTAMVERGMMAVHEAEMARQ
jgi:hypothetical protein